MFISPYRGHVTVVGRIKRFLYFARQRSLLNCRMDARCFQNECADPSFLSAGSLRRDMEIKTGKGNLARGTRPTTPNAKGHNSTASAVHGLPGHDNDSARRGHLGGRHPGGRCGVAGWKKYYRRDPQMKQFSATMMAAAKRPRGCWCSRRRRRARGGRWRNVAFTLLTVKGSGQTISPCTDSRMFLLINSSSVRIPNTVWLSKNSS